MAEKNMNTGVDNTAPVSPQVAAQVIPPDIQLTAHKAMQGAESQRRELLKVYKAEPLVSVNVSPLYAPYFGRTMRVMINGISVYVKVDGSIHNVPETFADEINSRITHINRNIKRQSRLENVAENQEGSPGELELY